jgi:hypothetical protein
MEIEAWREVPFHSLLKIVLHGFQPDGTTPDASGSSA